MTLTIEERPHLKLLPDHKLTRDYHISLRYTSMYRVSSAWDLNRNQALVWLDNIDDNEKLKRSIFSEGWVQIWKGEDCIDERRFLYLQDVIEFIHTRRA